MGFLRISTYDPIIAEKVFLFQQLIKLLFATN